MNAVDIILNDPTPDGCLCDAQDQECDQEANVQVSFRVHGQMLMGEEMPLCEGHLREVVDALSAGRFDEVDNIGGFTTEHGGAEAYIEEAAARGKACIFAYDDMANVSRGVRGEGEVAVATDLVSDVLVALGEAHDYEEIALLLARSLDAYALKTFGGASATDL